MSGPFSRTTTWALVAVSSVSLVGAVLLNVFAGELGTSRPSAGADGYSRSAIGHAVLIDVLDGVGIPVIRSRHDSAKKAGHGVLGPDRDLAHRRRR